MRQKKTGQKDGLNDLTKKALEEIQKDDQLVSAVTEKVVEKITPKIDTLFEKIDKRITDELNEVKGMIKPVTETQSQQDIISKIRQGMEDPEIQKLAKSLEAGGSNTVNSMVDNSPMGKFMQLMNMIKTLDGSGQANSYGLSPAIMAGIMERNMLSTMHMQQTLFHQVIKDELKKRGMDENQIGAYESVHNTLIDPLNKITQKPVDANASNTQVKSS